MGGALRQFSHPPSNELIPLTNDDYDEATHMEDVQARTTHRSGMILNAEELVALVEDAPAQVREERPELLGKLPAQGLLERVQLEFAGPVGGHVPGQVLLEHLHGRLDRHRGRGDKGGGRHLLIPRAPAPS